MGKQIQQLSAQKNKDEEEKQEGDEKQENDDEIVVEDPDQIDESQLEKIMPHDIIRCLILIYKNNGLPSGDDDNEEDGDSNVLLKQTKLHEKYSEEQIKKIFKVEVSIVHNNLSLSFITGLKLLDILRDDYWQYKVFQESFSKNFMEETVNQLM